MPGRSAIDEWRHLRDSWSAQGACPVLLGDREEVERAAEAIEGSDDDPEQILAAAKETSVDDFFAGRRASAEEEDGMEIPLGDWPDPLPGPQTEFSSHTEILSGRPKPLVYIARIPTVRPYEIPAYLGHGGWNECPAAAEQVAVHRHWHERYGSDILAIAGNVVECRVSRPPRNLDAAEALALEQFLYCADIVDQGTQSVRSLAAQLRRAPAWYFWWD